VLDTLTDTLHSSSTGAWTSWPATIWPGLSIPSGSSLVAVAGVPGNGCEAAAEEDAWVLGDRFGADRPVRLPRCLKV
jgi:hypothetical protein